MALGTEIALIKALGGNGGGTGGGVLVVNGTWNEAGTICTLDKTWQEIYDGGFGVVEIDQDTEKLYAPIINVIGGGGGLYYGVLVIYYGDSLDVKEFKATSASGYPTYTDE